MKIWLGKAESCSARSSCTHTMSKPLETKEVRGACSFTDSFVIAKTHIMTIRSTEPGSWFCIQCPFTSLKPHHLPRSASGKSLCQSSQIEFQHFPYWRKISFPHASSHNSLSVIKLVLSAFLMGFHKFSSPLSFWASCTLCQCQAHGFQLLLLIGVRATQSKDFFEVIHTSDFPSELAMIIFPLFSLFGTFPPFLSCWNASSFPIIAVASPLYLIYFSSFSVFPYKAFH